MSIIGTRPPLISETNLYELHHRARLGHKITVYNRSGHHVSGKEFDGKKLKEYKGIRMKYVPTIDKKGLAAMSASFFAAVAAAFGKYDVVHFHAEGPCAMLWLLFMDL